MALSVDFHMLGLPHLRAVKLHELFSLPSAEKGIKRYPTYGSHCGGRTGRMLRSGPQIMKKPLPLIFTPFACCHPARTSHWPLVCAEAVTDLLGIALARAFTHLQCLMSGLVSGI